MNVLEAASVFNLESLPNDWVEELWGSDFLEDRDLPFEFSSSYEEDDFLRFMSAVIDSIKDLRQDKDNSSTITWQVLFDLQFDHKSFICLMSTFIKSNYTCQESRILGLTATRLYFNLLSIPGAIILNVFNPLLYQKVLSTLTLAKLCCSSQGAKKYTKKKCKSPPIEDTPQDSVQPELHESDKAEILFEIGLILNDMLECFLSLHLANEPDSLKETIKILVDLSRLEKHVNVYLVSSIKSNSAAYVTRKAYDTLERICVEEQGKVRSIVMYIARCLLPSLTLDEEDYKMHIMEKNEIHRHTLSFIEKILSKNNKGIDDGVIALFQQLCIRLPEREEIKGKLVPNIIAFLMILNQKLFHEAVLWVVALMHNKTLKHRLAAADIVSGLLDGADKIYKDPYPDHAQSPNVPGPSQDIKVPERKLLFKTLFSAVFSGVCDSSSTMRSKCLNIFNRLLHSSHLEIKEIVNEIFHSNLIVNDRVSVDRPESCIFDFCAFFDQNPTTFPSNSLPEGNRLAYLISNLTSDEKVFVRKNACQALASICLINENFLTSKILKIFILRCKDLYVSVRKSVAKNLTDLIFHYPLNDGVISAWVNGVVQLVVDNETKSAEKVLEYFKSVLFDNIVKYENTKEPINILPWKVLREISKKEKTNLLGFACYHWNLQGHFRTPFFRILQTHISTEYNNEVWYFITCLSNFTTIPNSDFIYNYFMQNIFSTSKVEEFLSIHVLESLYLNWKTLKLENQEDLFLKFKSVVEDFDVPFPMIPRIMDFIYFLKTDTAKAWCGILVEKCESNLKNTISPGSPIHYNENLICQHIVTLGEAALFHPGVSSDTLTYLANIIDRTFTTNEGQNEGGRWNGIVSPRLRSVALVTLGKICLQDHYISKKYAPLVAGILNNSSSPTTLKINAMIMLSDLCRRFTSVVEDYLGNMFISLRDNDLTVRKNSLTLLTSLFQEDYLRIKKHIFFYFLIMLLDTSQEIRDLTESFIANTLKRKNPKILSQYFISSIMFFNDFEDHPSFKMDDLSQPERIVFCIAGVTNIKDREKIYRFMLTHMMDDERFYVSNRLCKDVMELVNEDLIPLDQRGSAVLKDTLSCLSWKEMRLENLKKPPAPEEAETPNDFTDMAKHMILSKILEENYSAHIIPVITQLKKKLMAVKSPLVRDLMICLRELMKDFKDKIKEMLDDPLLAKEVEYDLRNAYTDLDDTVEETYETGMEAVALKDLKIVVERLSEHVLRGYQSSIGSETPCLASPSLNGAKATPESAETHQSSPSKRKGRVHSAFSPPLSPVPGSSRKLHTPKKRLGRSQSTIVTSSPVVNDPQTLETKGTKKELFASPSPVSSPPHEFKSSPRQEGPPPSPQPGCSWMPDSYASPASPSVVPPPLPDLPTLPLAPSRGSSRKQRKSSRCSKSPELPLHLELPEQETGCVSSLPLLPSPSPAGVEVGRTPKGRRRRKRKGSASSSVSFVLEEPSSPQP